MTAPVRLGPSPSGGGPAASLSTRQQTVLRYAAAGLSIPETAKVMHLAVSTIHYHQQVIVTALRARNMTNAVFLGCRAGLLDGRPRRHGDHAGFAAHVYRGEDPCEACQVGERAYRNGRNAARRTTDVHAA